ncbi:MAG: hypothetical protein ND807_09520, partial [Vicinamibacterales bacterium]|nr:hypothetical protein [Vicinamibacterales bacterium]
MALALAMLVGQGAGAQETTPRFGDAYSLLEPRRQQLVNAWVASLAEVTGQKLEAGPFYDDIISLSAKTTFDAVTHALMTTSLTDASGGRIGDGLDVIERVESVRGEVAGASGDRQFRMYVRLLPNAIDTLSRSREFRRGMDNSLYHKGYPINYRQQGGVPSIQISIATDRRRADIDVDYRSSMFPVSMFNGHLSASNSDVRAGNNSDRHDGRWAGLQNWWRGFFGVRVDRSAEDESEDRTLVLPTTPRAGSKNIDVMVHDFLQAWLVEGDVRTAMGYVSERAYACMAQDADDPSDLNRGMAPFQLMTNLKAAYEALGKHDSLVGLTVGVRLTRPALKVVRQPHHAQFVIYAVPDDVAAAFDCESRLTLGEARNAKRTYGNYFGSTFYVDGRTDSHVALLWARENRYWKLVSWQTGDDEEGKAPEAPPEEKVVRIGADPSLVQAARGFLESWLIRRDYDTAFRYLSSKSYACYNLAKGPDAAPST